MRVDLDADRAHHALADRLHDEGRRVIGDEPDDEERQKERRDLGQPGQIADRNVAINRDLCEPRLGQLAQRRDQDYRERHGHRGDVRAEIRQQAAHQPGVVRLPDDVVVRERGVVSHA